MNAGSKLIIDLNDVYESITEKTKINNLERINYLIWLFNNFVITFYFNFINIRMIRNFRINIIF